MFDNRFNPTQHDELLQENNELREENVELKNEIKDLEEDFENVLERLNKANRILIQFHKHGATEETQAELKEVLTNHPY